MLVNKKVHFVNGRPMFFLNNILRAPYFRNEYLIVVVIFLPNKEVGVFSHNEQQCNRHKGEIRTT